MARQGCFRASDEDGTSIGKPSCSGYGRSASTCSAHATSPYNTSSLRSPLRQWNTAGANTPDYQRCLCVVGITLHSNIFRYLRSFPTRPAGAASATARAWSTPPLTDSGPCGRGPGQSSEASQAAWWSTGLPVRLSSTVQRPISIMFSLPSSLSCISGDLGAAESLSPLATAAGQSWCAPSVEAAESPVEVLR